MKNKNKSLLPFVVCGLPVAILCTIIGMRETRPIHSIEANADYTLKLDASYAPATFDGSGIIAGPKNVTFEYNSAGAFEGGLMTLSYGEVLRNNNQITSITSYNVVFSGDCRISFMWDFGKPAIDSFAQGSYLQSGVTYSIGSDYYFFELTANSGTVNITSVTITYSCIATPSGPAFTLAPDGLSYIVTGYTKQPYDLEIPETYEGLPVTEIAPDALSNIYTLNSVVIPDSVTKIGASAFYNCDNLVDVTLPSGLLELPTNIFKSCAILDTIVLPDTLVSIGDYAFSESGLSSITIPSSVTTFGVASFFGTSRLSEFYFDTPVNVTRIADNQFEGSGIKNFELPEGILSIGDTAFGSTSLTEIKFSSTLTTIGDYAFDQCYDLATFSGTLSNIVNIGSFAFNNTAWIENERAVNPLVIFDNRIVIDGQSYLVSGEVTLPSSITHIAASAFVENTWITSIIMPSSLISIGDYALASNTSLTTIDFTAATNLLCIGTRAFFYSTLLATMTIPASVLDVGDDAFLGTAWLNSHTGSGIMLIINGRVVINAQVSGAITLPSTVTAISSQAFQNNAIESIALPDGLLRIGDYAFSGCAALTSINLSNSLMSIGNYAFNGCGVLPSIIIPLAVSWIGGSAFDGCLVLTINAIALSQPAGWDSEWNIDERPVTWGYGIE